jgi:Domain of unknown function (DUF4357)
MNLARKTIKIFLLDGDPNGRLTCELTNWTGKAYKIPRNRLKECNDRDDLRGTGVYLLFGRDDEHNELVYVGEGEEILRRIAQHLPQKEFWNEVIIFVSKDENLNKAHIKYLENRLFDIAKSVGRYKVTNGNTPTRSSISESDQAEMEEYLENIKLLVNTLGHKVFEDKREEPRKALHSEEIFWIKAARGADSQGRPTSDGFVVFKGSKAALSTVPSMTSSFVKLRETLIKKAVLVQVGEILEFSEDYVFSSPSTAAAMVMGRNANGLEEWKLENGISLKSIETESANDVS